MNRIGFEKRMEVVSARRTKVRWCVCIAVLVDIPEGGEDEACTRLPLERFKMRGDSVGHQSIVMVKEDKVVSARFREAAIAGGRGTGICLTDNFYTGNSQKMLMRLLGG